MTAYYNEHDEFAAQWLRNLIAGNMIAPGDVDERSIEDVVPVELAKYTQCHFFAGIGVWSYAMRRAGWPDDRRAWSGSCPCQPFSQAGQGEGFADERHLWPAFFHLIEQCGPDVVFGEQVASKNGIAWLDLVQSDMEAANYAFGAVVTPAAGFGAPHIRHRTYWMAYADDTRSQRRGERRDCPKQWPFGASGLVSRMADAAHQQHDGAGLGGAGRWFEHTDGGATGGLANPVNGPVQNAGWGPERRAGQSRIGEEPERPGPVNGFWQDVDWLRCRDDKWRPVEPGTFPLVNGAPNRVGLLRGYGNAIDAPQAEEFIRVALEYAP